MQYSSALFLDSAESLDQAQLNKLERIARRLQLGADDHLLEIGTGWGGLAVFMAERTGCRVTTTTISAEQYRDACRRVRAAGLEDRVEVLMADYRELDGTYDKVVSVEMIEAVGADFLETYLETIRDRLAPEGLALIQAITIADRNYPTHLKTVDFIKKYIFPGGTLPSIGSMMHSVARATDLQLVHLHDIGIDYARTLHAWRERFFDRLAAGYGCTTFFRQITRSRSGNRSPFVKHARDMNDMMSRNNLRQPKCQIMIPGPFKPFAHPADFTKCGCGINAHVARIPHA